MNGYRRCKCRDEAKKEIGAKCPLLKRSDGSWNPLHGTWYGKTELSAAPDGSRVILRQGGFATQSEMTAWFEEASRLLSIPDAGPDGHKERTEILSLIRESRRRKAALPDYDDIRRRYAYGAAFRAGTTGEYLLSWLEERHGAENLAPTTMLGYESHITRVFLPAIGEIPLDKLRPVHVAKCMSVSELPGSPGPATRQRMRATLRKALADAKRAGLVTINAAASDSVQLRSGDRPRLRVWTAAEEEAWRSAREQQIREAGPDKRELFATWRLMGNRPAPSMVWSLAHTGAFLDAAASDRMYPLFHLIAFRGLRRGEACGLKWADADLDTATLTVRRQLVQLGWKVKETAPKSRASDGVVALDSATVAVLRAWRKTQLEERMAWGSAWSDTGYVFTRADGKPWHPAYVTTRFERIAYAADLPPVRLHDLRHGAATIAHAAGASLKAIQAMLRHSSITITADTYTSVLPEVDREMAEAMVSMVPRAAVAGAPSIPDGLPSVSQRRTKSRGLR